MKKYFVFLGIAALTLAACTKTEIDETAIPDQKIDFAVANYATPTRAAGDPLTSLNDEGFTSFKTTAKFFPEIGNVQDYMTGVVVNYNANPKEWAPERDYYWPKTGYINFYSYVSTTGLEPTINFNDAKTEATAAYSGTILSNSNILLADAALNQTKASKKDTYTSISGVQGVPTLFRHLLAKINFKVQVKTTKAHANTKFVVKIVNLDATGTTPAALSNLVAPNTGTYSLTNTYATGVATNKWVPAGNAKVWTPTTATETINTLTPEMTLAASATANDSGTPIDLIAERTILPQTLTNAVVFSIAYQVEAYFGEETKPYLTEVLHYSQPLTAYTPESSVTAWEVNTKYTYTITIDPVGDKITFDPAVEEWATVDSGTYQLPINNN